MLGPTTPVLSALRLAASEVALAGSFKKMAKLVVGRGGRSSGTGGRSPRAAGTLKRGTAARPRAAVTAHRLSASARAAPASAAPRTCCRPPRRPRMGFRATTASAQTAPRRPWRRAVVSEAAAGASSAWETAGAQMGRRRHRGPAAQAPWRRAAQSGSYQWPRQLCGARRAWGAPCQATAGQEDRVAQLSRLACARGRGVTPPQAPPWLRRMHAFGGLVHACQVPLGSDPSKRVWARDRPPSALLLPAGPA